MNLSSNLQFFSQITLFDSADLAGAIAYSRLLKLTLFVNGQMVAGKSGVRGANSLSNVVSGNVKQELREIRDRINHLLDIIEDQVHSWLVLLQNFVLDFLWLFSFKLCLAKFMQPRVLLDDSLLLLTIMYAIIQRHTQYLLHFLSVLL